MNAWLKRGLQVAVLSGGLLVLGAGLASADETTINDDVAADVSVSVGDTTLISVPVDISGNAITLLGDDNPVGELVGGILGNMDSDAALDVVADVQIGSESDAAPAEAPLISVPITITDNAVGVGGDAVAVANDPADEAPEAGSGDSLINIPVNVCGNGVGLLDEASAECAATTGDEPAGSSVISLPVVVCGNGIGVLGAGSGECTVPNTPTGTMLENPTDPTIPTEPINPLIPATPSTPSTPGAPSTPAPSTPAAPANPGLLSPNAPPVDRIAPPAVPQYSGPSDKSLAETGAGVNWVSALTIGLLPPSPRGAGAPKALPDVLTIGRHIITLYPQKKTS